MFATVTLHSDDLSVLSLDALSPSEDICGVSKKKGFCLFSTFTVCTAVYLRLYNARFCYVLCLLILMYEQLSVESSWTLVRLFIHLSCSVVGSLSDLYIQLSDKQVGGTDEVWGLWPQTDE